MRNFLMLFRVAYKLIIPGVFLTGFGLYCPFSEIEDLGPLWWRFLIGGVCLTACGVYMAYSIVAAEMGNDHDEEKPITTKDSL